VHARQLRQVGPEDVAAALRMLSYRRSQLSASRTRIVCRLHSQLRQCVKAADPRRNDKQLVDIDGRIVEAVTALRATLTDIAGFGPILAAKIVGYASAIDRSRSRAHFASYAGTAPIEASSGDVSRHRLSRRGNRRHDPHGHGPAC
jgi:transposase